MVDVNRTHLSVPLTGVQERSFVEHQSILEASAAGDILMLESILVGHILGTRQSYLRALREGSIPARP